jgi:hypothetical protein
MRVEPGSPSKSSLREVADIAVVVVLLVGGGAAALSLSHDPRRTGTASFSPNGMFSLALSVDPASWWMLAGNSTSFWATWTGVPAGCVGTPLWYRWMVYQGFADGTLTPSNGSSTNFTASAERTGTAELEVRSGLVVSCGSDRTTATRNATANVSVVAPLALQNLTVSPNPLETGTVAHLMARVANGEPPYRVRVDWGDGNISFYNVTAPGSVSFPHTFSNGSFVPAVLVSDSAGLVANATVDEPLSVSTGLAVAVDTPTAVAEVGVPVNFSGVILHAPTEFGSVTACGDEYPSDTRWTHDAVTETNFTCTFAAPGVAAVDFEVIPVSYVDGPTSVQLNEPVAPPLELGLEPPGGPAEAGMPAVVLARVVGGVSPFQVSWRVVGNASAQEKTCYADGTIALPVWPAAPGTYAVSVRVTDAVGVLVENGSTGFPVDPSLEVVATAGSSLTTGGAEVAVGGGVTGGVPPFDWWVVPTVAPTNEGVGNGSLSSVGSLTWNGTYLAEGITSISLLVVDRDGAEWSETFAVSLVPVLSVAAHLNGSSTAAGRSLTLNLSLEGGLPPFQTNLTSSTGEKWNRTAEEDGSFSWSFPVGDMSPIVVGISVHDRLGETWNESVSVVLPPSPPGPSVDAGGSPMTAWLGSVGLLGVVGLGTVLLLRHRRRRAEPTPSALPDPVAVLRRIIEPAEGAERSTVELLAEEAGVPPELARTTIDRLVAEGTLRIESDEEGEEVLAWSDRT